MSHGIVVRWMDGEDGGGSGKGDVGKDLDYLPVAHDISSPS